MELKEMIKVMQHYEWWMNISKIWYNIRYR